MSLDKGHAWVVRDNNGETLSLFYATLPRTLAFVTGAVQDTAGEAALPRLREAVLRDPRWPDSGWVPRRRPRWERVRDPLTIADINP